MSKQVTVEELVANIEEYLEEARNGQALSVVKEGDEIASIEPPKRKGLKIIRHDPSLRLQDFKPGAPLKRAGSSGVDWLIEERERERSDKNVNGDDDPLFAQRADRSKRLGDFKPKSLTRKLDFDVVEMIREDRDKR